MSTNSPEKTKEKPQPNRSGFVRRLVAILVFAALGTYAVFQTIPRKPTEQPLANAATDADSHSPLIGDGDVIQPVGHVQNETQPLSRSLEQTSDRNTDSDTPSVSNVSSFGPGSFGRSETPQSNNLLGPPSFSPGSSLGSSQPSSEPTQGSRFESSTAGNPRSDESNTETSPRLLGPPRLSMGPGDSRLADDDERAKQSIEGQEFAGTLPPLRGLTSQDSNLENNEDTGRPKTSPNASALDLTGRSSLPSDLATQDHGAPTETQDSLSSRPESGQWPRPSLLEESNHQASEPQNDQSPQANSGLWPPNRANAPGFGTSAEGRPSLTAETDNRLPAARPDSHSTSPVEGPRSNTELPHYDAAHNRPTITGVSTPQPIGRSLDHQFGSPPSRLDESQDYPRGAPQSIPRGMESPQVPVPTMTQARPGDRQLDGAQTPSLSVEKIAPREIQVNQTARFRLVIRNTGRVAADDVTVDDQVPDSTEFENSTPQPRHRGANGQIQWHLGTLQPGEERTIEIDLRPLRPGEIGSVAQVSFSTKASMRSLVTQPILSIEHTAPAKVLIGDKLTLDITVSNTGTGAAKDVIIQETVPPQLSFSDQFRDLEYSVGTLAPGQSRNVQLTLQAVQIGKFKNVIQAVAEGLPPVQHASDIEVTAPRLHLTSEGPHKRYLKRDATFEFTLANQGTASATNIDLIAKLPRGLKFNNTNNQGQYDPGTHAVYWSLAQLNAGQSASVRIEIQPSETGAQDIEFIASADLRQKESALHKLIVEHLVDVHFEIDDVDDHIEIGSQTDYRIRIVNQGTKPATNVRFSVAFDAGIKPVRVNGSLSADIRGQQVVFPSIANLNPGEEVIVSITGQGQTPGDHRVSANLQADGREIDITKQESTRVYADR